MWKLVFGCSVEIVGGSIVSCRVLFVRFYRWSFHLFCLYRWLWSLLQIVHGILYNNFILAEYWSRRLRCIRGNIRMFWHVRYVKTIEETGSFIIIMTWRCFFPWQDLAITKYHSGSYINVALNHENEVKGRFMCS